MDYNFRPKASWRPLQAFEDSTYFSLKKDFVVNLFKILKNFYLFFIHFSSAKWMTKTASLVEICWETILITLTALSPDNITHILSMSGFMCWSSHWSNFASFQSWNMRSMFGGWQLSALTRPAERRLLWNASWCRRCWLWRCSSGRSWERFTGKQGPACPTSPSRDLHWDKTCSPSSVLITWMSGHHMDVRPLSASVERKVF